jgi:Tfp pilus assembly protein PilF
MTLATRDGLRAAARLLRSALPALVIGLGLAGCAGAQKPAAEAEQPKPAAAAPAAPLTGLPGEAPVELSRSAKGAFEEGVRLEQGGDLKGAAAAFEHAFKADAAAAFAGVNAGVLQERMGDDARARVLYLQVLDKTPTFFPAAQNLVRLDARHGKAADAEAELKARIEKSPDAVALRNGLAEAYLAQGKLDPAEDAARKALKIEEKSVPAMVNLATVYARKRRFELAKMVLENAKLVDDRDPSLWNRLGFVELSLGERNLALDCFRTAAALRPDYPEAHANYGAMLADSEDYQNAAVELELAVKYAPQNALAWLNLGNAYRGLKEFAKAEDAYGRALLIDPALADARFNLAILYLDGDKPGVPTLQRLQQGLAFFDAYEQQGGKDPRVAAYRKDAARSIEREKKRLEREEKDRLRKEAEAKKKADESAKQQEAAPATGAAPEGAKPGDAKPAAKPAGAKPAAETEAPPPALKKKKAPAAKKKAPAAQGADEGAGAERGDR